MRSRRRSLISVPVTNAVNRSCSLNDGLISWWSPLPQLGWWNTWYDIGGRERHGTLTNGAEGWMNERGYSVSFDGDNDFIEMGSIPLGHPLQCTKGLFFSCWFYAKSGGDPYQRLIDKSDGGSGLSGYAVWVNALNMQVGVESKLDESNYISWISEEDVYEFNKWHYLHAELSPDSVAPIVYIDGTYTGAGVLSGQAGSGYPPNEVTGMRFGSWNHSTGREFKGLLQNIVMFDGLRTPAEVEALHQDSLTGYRQTLHRISGAVGKAGGATGNRRRRFFLGAGA